MQIRHTWSVLPFLLVLGACSSPVPVPSTPLLESEVEQLEDAEVTASQTFTFGPASLKAQTAGSLTLSDVSVTLELLRNTGTAKYGTRGGRVTYRTTKAGTQARANPSALYLVNVGRDAGCCTNTTNAYLRKLSFSDVLAAKQSAYADKMPPKSTQPLEPRDPLCVQVTAPLFDSSPQVPLGTVQNLKLCETPADQKALLERAVDGLLYLSESDRPWTYTLLEGQGYADFEAAQAGKTLERRKTPTEFFTQLSVLPIGDPVGIKNARRYFKLGKLLERSFTELRVYWVTDPANPVEVHLYVVGLNHFGLALLKTISIET